MLIPYNVDRQTRRMPRFTYGLMAVNVLVFFFTILTSNINLPSDKIAGREAIKQWAAQSGEGGDWEESSEGVTGGATDNVATPSGSSSSSFSLSGFSLSHLADSKLSASGPSASDFPTANQFQFLRRRMYRSTAKAIVGSGAGSRTAQATDGSNSGEGSTASTESSTESGSSDASAEGATGDEDRGENFMLRMYQFGAIEEAYKKANDEAGYTKFWQIRHAFDSFVMEPHYSAMNTFAYRANNPTFLGILGSMFLHGGIEHLIGNMLFLWVFGRALEDALGPYVYLGAYLVCGIAATVLYHIMMMNFTPQSAAVPAIGASGAIAGVLGLFAMRFYRTPVRIFFMSGYALYLLGALWAISLYLIRYQSVNPAFPVLISAVIVAALFYFGQDWGIWNSFKVASMYAIGFWLLVSNVLPGVITLFRTEKAGGVGYWAHIGGFMCGMMYALMIGAKNEGKTEYLIEDAQKSLDKKQGGNALEYAQDLLKHQPENPTVYELLAEAYDFKNNEDAALDNYELAIDKYLKKGERDSAARTYLNALHKHPLFILQPATQFIISSQIAVNGDYEKAAENLAKIPFTFPDAPEGELSLLRAAQMYIDHLNQPEMGLHLLNTMLQHYPETQWMAQVEGAMRKAQYQLSAPPDPAASVSPPAAKRYPGAPKASSKK
jgi:membrane associated rhomboid family serine protease